MKVVGTLSVKTGVEERWEGTQETMSSTHKQPAQEHTP